MAEKVPLGEQIAAVSTAHAQRTVMWLTMKGGYTQPEAEAEHRRMEAAVKTLTWLRDNPDKVKR